MHRTPEPNLITVVLADSHPVVRTGLRTILESETDLRIVGETGDGLQALAIVERLSPRIAILEAFMPGMNGLEAVRQMTARFLGTHVLILSGTGDERHVLAALRNGACGYILKTAPPEALIDAARTVSSGGRYLSPPLAERAFEYYARQSDGAPPDRYDSLTPREREILQLIAEGNRNAEIAERLSISPRTAEVHRASIFEKLGLRTQTELVLFAIRNGVLLLDD